ncbi:MAG: winged helix-turn-helix transcriptional regulator [Dehalococcoidia bacterium]|nr:winged helix-turn-helix transcriptional regulator [Dehalococcoidia bacterium]
MQGTRERILEYVCEHRGARAEQLAERFGITAAAVRRHLDNLRADGLVEARAVKQATGRPYHAYFPTDKATQTMPPAYANLLERMLRSLGEQDEVIATVMSSVAESLASRHRGEIPDSAAIEEVIAQVTASLKTEGILEAWRSEADGFHLVNSSCPYHKAAEISTLPCESDRKAIELLLGQDVEQLNRIVDGAPLCEYLVRGGSGQRQIIELG